jgi:hypothetical protein
VTFALGAAAIAGGCGSKDSGSGGNGDGSVGCPAQEPAPNTPCDPPPAPLAPCYYPIGMCRGEPLYDSAQCTLAPNRENGGPQGIWTEFPMPCNPPAPVYDAGPDVDDAAPDVSDGGGHD